MIQSIKAKNETFKELRLKLRQGNRQSLIDLENVLSTVQDKKAFVFLMDAYETEKEITREILEQMLETSIAINTDIITALEDSDKSQIIDTMNEIFTGKNIKSLIIAAIVLGVLISISTNSDVASKIVEVVIPATVEKTK